MDGFAALLALPPVTPAYVQARTSDGRAETIAVLHRADALLADRRHSEALDALGEVSVPAVSAPGLALRILLTESWAQLHLGRLDEVLASLERARPLAEPAVFTNRDAISPASRRHQKGVPNAAKNRTLRAVILFPSRRGRPSRLRKWVIMARSPESPAEARPQ